jgi:hypothetical protein
MLPKINSILVSIERGAHDQQYHSLWNGVLDRLTDILLSKMTAYFMLPDPVQQDMVTNSILELSCTISKQWLELVIYQYCHNNQMVQPQKNGLSGLAVLKIIDILMKLRESESVFDLLNQEQIQIQRQLNDLSQQPIYVLPSTRI